MFEKLYLIAGAVALSVGFLGVFFGGTLEGARIGLEILGAAYLLQNGYDVMKKEAEKRKQEREMQVITDKYFPSE